ncbi:MAG: RNA methyltransferase [Candidatus Omnitrophica bacterium]|nr:RNA methyltransferase [Candidatus Omnitrophota bacterium]
MRKCTHEEIVSARAGNTNKRKLPIAVLLNDIRSLYNVGSVFRTADGAGIEKVWLCGITGYPPNPQLQKTALGSQNSVSWEYRKDARVLIRELREEKYQIVLLEQAKGSVLYNEFEPEFPLCLVVGNEIKGVSEQLLSDCDYAVEIEMEGKKNSLNASTAFAIVAYHYRNIFKSQSAF